MRKLETNDLVIINEGKYKGVHGKVVTAGGHLTSVMLSTTKEVVEIQEVHLEKLALAMMEKDYKEYENLINALDLDIQKI